MVDARKQRYGRAEALSLLEGVHMLEVARRNQVTSIDLRRDRPDDEELAALLLGPTGNLRAPTSRVGRTLIVGFNAELYEACFG